MSMTSNEPFYNDEEHNIKIGGVTLEEETKKYIKEIIEAQLKELKEKESCETTKDLPNNMLQIHKTEIIEKLISNNKSYIENSLWWIKFWNSMAGTFTAIRYILLILIVPTLSFASTAYKYPELNFTAGTLSLCGIGFEKFSQYCSANSKKRNKKTNEIIRKFGIHQELTDTAVDSYSLQQQNNTTMV